MHRLEVTLKQHTPLIHFQHDQEGATLRASEVKPKLDRFILTKLGNKYSSTEDLNYKMKISSKGEKTEYIISSRLDRNKPQLLKEEGFEVIEESQYFAQESEYQIFEYIDRKNKKLGYQFKFKRGDKYKEALKKLSKKGVKYDTTEVFISSYDEELMFQIIDLLPEFFVIENFGTRNGKGFGSYTVQSMKINNAEIQFSKNIDMWLKNNYDFVYKKDFQEGESPFSVIHKDYKLIKAGHGSFEGYAKSKLMLYGLSLEKKQRWEKKFIKEQTNNVFATPIDEDYYVLKDNQRHVNTNKGSGNHYYLRAFLGLTEQFEFLLENPPDNNTNNKLLVKMNSNDDIQRFKSPLIFIVIDNTIYLAGNEIKEDIRDKSFTLFATIQGDDEWENEEIDRLIKTPDFFSLRKFMYFAMRDTKEKKLNYTIIKET